MRGPSPASGRWPRDVLGQEVTPELVLRYYAHGCFPMGDHRSDQIAWYQPLDRAVITWDKWKVPRSLRQWVRRQPFRMSIDTAFHEVITACAQRDQTWICHDIETLYRQLHALGFAHSVEAWLDDELVGGCYGLALGGIFCGESMFHRANNAAKSCIWHLGQHLQQQGFIALDCQQHSAHMAQFGCYSITADEFSELLAQGLTMSPAWLD